MAERRRGDKPYTKRGDTGTTGLLFGGRVSKADLAPEAAGACDEACAALGVARAEAVEPELVDLLKRIQRELFVIGAELATSPENRSKLTPGKTAVTDDMVDALEAMIDKLVDEVELPREFVLPGHDRLSAALDFARAAVRRAERAAVGLERAGRLPGTSALAYLNRLGDLVYMLARREEGEDYDRLEIF